MFEEILTRVSAEVSAERAFDHVAAICRFHRIQASPGFREAAGYCVDRMLETTPDAKVIHYPAETGARFWQYPSFPEWSCRKGVLSVLSPDELAGKFADYEDCPISLIQRSKATPPEGLTAELVYVGEGKNIKDYKGARGKIVICDSYCLAEVYEAAAKAGAAGIILYKQRPLPPLRKGSGVQGIRQYNSFWWDETDLFGFVLTPEDGERLVSYLRSPASAGKPVEVWAHIESDTYPGTLEVVTALIPGNEAREIVVVAHLCHPKPSAGDNASGVAALLEAHRALRHLIEKGELPVPEYGIRFLIVPEITGTFAFLSRERRISRRLMLGLNLDMVGQKQEATGSTLCIESPPMAAASFAPYLVEEIASRAFEQGTNPGGTGGLSAVRMKATPFSGGSDHFILSDPAVGVPTPMLIQWPDAFYHTSGDTPDKISPDTLRRVAVLACAYAYTCGLADEEDLSWITQLAGRAIRKGAIDEMGLFAASGAEAWISREYKAGVILEHGKSVLRSIGALLPKSKGLKARLRAEARAFAQCVREEARVYSVGGRKRKRRLTEGRKRLAMLPDKVVTRVVPGPPHIEAALKGLSPRWKARYRRWTKLERKARMIEMLALYWADGKRSIADICRLVAAELGYTNPKFIGFYFDLLAEADIIEYT
jgi:aminopeptidase YwaD